MHQGKGVKAVARRVLLGVLIAVAVLPGSARAEITDAALAEAIAEVVQNYAQFTIFDDVNISVLNRAVTLTGRVTMPNKRDDLGKRVAKIDGVRSLVNDIQVLPVSPLDAELRVRVAQAIYGHAAFWHYTAMALPPIHIIVEHGHITLTGRVNSATERALAFALAQVSGAFDVKNELKLDNQ